MVGWCHRLNGHELEQTRGDGEGQGSLVCCNPWGCKESDMTEQLSLHFSSVATQSLKEFLVELVFFFFFSYGYSMWDHRLGIEPTPPAKY